MTSQQRQAARRETCGHVFTKTEGSSSFSPQIVRVRCGKAPRHWGDHGDPVSLLDSDLPDPNRKTSDKLIAELREAIFLETQQESERLRRKSEQAVMEEREGKLIALRKLEAAGVEASRQAAKIEQLQKRLQKKHGQQIPQLSGFALEELFAEIKRRTEKES